MLKNFLFRAKIKKILLRDLWRKRHPHLLVLNQQVPTRALDGRELQIIFRSGMGFFFVEIAHRFRIPVPGVTRIGDENRWNVGCPQFYQPPAVRFATAQAEVRSNEILPINCLHYLALTSHLLATVAQKLANCL